MALGVILGLEPTQIIEGTFPTSRTIIQPHLQGLVSCQVTEVKAWHLQVHFQPDRCQLSNCGDLWEKRKDILREGFNRQSILNEGLQLLK